MRQPEGPERPRSPGHPCPECGAHRRPDNTPACGCGARASDALREARTAQAAAAEDFDPLRIRPYVELDGTPDGAAGDAVPAPAPDGRAPGAPPAPADPDATMPLRAVDGEVPEATTPSRAAGVEASEATSVLPTPLAPPAGAPSAHDLRLFDAPEPGAAEPGRPAAPAGRPPRRRRGVLLGAAGAVAAVLGATAYAGGLFSYETPSRDGAAAKEVRAEVPDPSSGEASSAGAAPSTASAPPVSASPSPSASASPSASPSPSPSPSASASASDGSSAPTPSAGPTQTATTARTDDPERGPGDRRGRGNREDQPGDGTVLRRGDSGPDVAELQHRLGQLYLYTGEIDGYFGHEVESALRNYQWARGIRSDDLGAYGPETRRQLESETREP